MKCTYVQRIFIMFIHIGIRQTRNTDDFLGSGTKLLFTFLSIKFSDMRRERERDIISYSTDCSYIVSSQLIDSTSARASRRPQLVSPQRAPKIHSLRLSPNLNYSSFFKSQYPKPIASGHDVIHIPSPISTWGFIVTSVIVTSSPHAREHLHSMCEPNKPMH